LKVILYEYLIHCKKILDSKTLKYKICVILFCNFPAFSKLALNFIVVMSMISDSSCARVSYSDWTNVSGTRRALELIVILRGQYGWSMRGTGREGRATRGGWNKGGARRARGVKSMMASWKFHQSKRQK